VVVLSCKRRLGVEDKDERRLGIFDMCFGIRSINLGVFRMNPY